jgi:hypothetical protein
LPASLEPTIRKATVNVKVVKCDYEVGAVHILDWDPDPDIHGTWAAVMDDVRVVADEDGQLTGSGRVDWAGGLYLSPDCTMRSSLPPSSVAVTGGIGEDDSVSLRLVYEPTVVEHDVRCSGPGRLTWDFAAQIALEPVEQVFSAEGGSIQVSRAGALRGAQGQRTGLGLRPELSETNVVTVEPIRDPGVAAIGMAGGDDGQVDRALIGD